MRRKNIKNKSISKSTLKNSKVYIWSAFCLILVTTGIYMTIESSTNGAEIAALQEKQTLLLTRQRELHEQLVQLLSVNKLQEQSQILGFAKVSDLVYITDAAPVAAKLP